ncbi:maleylpyruvate isomerase N-terminal domain-containing protein [Brachybacterium subflavum]|uniref:maleylpyruvate isomerase N-terminal domain-containing protein n=1 Tax=Brachybacterium subflavum TaxID=2585206 RepID=UPI0012666E9A|nr:maleylpyruvate isomerase N-terminal domain-containing protein [Brachybacterium subflavum]
MTQATDLIAEEAERFADALRGPDPSAPVPTCPDWTSVDLLWHLTEVHEFWAGVLGSGALTDADAEAIDAAKAPRPEGPGARNQLVERREQATAALLAQLTTRGGAETCWSWFPADQTVGFTRRMQVHEATVHRVDAQLTANVPVTAISEDVATDGIDHAVGVMWAASWDWIPEWAEVESLAVLTLQVRDGQNDGTRAGIEVEIARWHGTRPRDGEELSQLLARPLPGEGQGGGGGGESSDAVGALPRAVASGLAPALYLWLWGRERALDVLEEGAQSVELTGDATAVRAVRERVAQGMD